VYRLSRIAVATAVLAIPALACNWRVPERILEARKPNVTLPRFLKPNSEDKAPSTADATLLLFIHGVFGDTVSTWSRDNRDSLGTVVLDRPEFAKGFDAFAFGFPSEIVRAGSFRIPEAAKALSSEVTFRAFLTKYKRIVIVAHSMGGLIALEALTTFPPLRQNVPLVVTFATPYDGAQVTRLARNLLKNPAIEDMLPRDGNSFLTSLSNRWKEAKKSEGFDIKVICAYETVAIPAVGVIVPATSASSLCDGTADPIAEDHLGIIKPDTNEHQSVKVLVNALRSLTAQDKLAPTQRQSTAGPSIANLYSYPPGYAVAGATKVSFHVQGSDSSGELLTYTWELGDGTVLSGARVDHTYSTANDFRVVVTARTPRGAETQREMVLPVRSLTGEWSTVDGAESYRLTQTGTSITGFHSNDARPVTGGVYPNTTRALQTDWAGYVQIALPGNPKPRIFDGRINPALNQLILDGENRSTLTLNRVERK
jgi:PKD domain-containing protein/alpha/beta hydrolase family protein